MPQRNIERQEMPLLGCIEYHYELKQSEPLWTQHRNCFFRSLQMFNPTGANTLERVHWFRTFHFSFLSDPNLSSTNTGTAGTVNVIFWPERYDEAAPVLVVVVVVVYTFLSYHH